MKIPWGTIGHFGLDMAKHAIPAIGMIETAGEMFKNTSGKDKQNAVLDYVLTQVRSTFGAIGPLLAVNPRIAEKIRAVVHAVVDLQDTVAEEVAKVQP
jgi:hypothetical protein